ncbi:MAG: RNA polymerase sigma-70 factor [Tannerella sp.]|nr:RNA polymerase sigma-70 factor [Tannerella sp.]
MIYRIIQNDLDPLFWRIALKDDRDAFKELFVKYFAPLCVYAQRFITDKDSCEDIVQDVFYKLWKNRKTLEIRNSTRNFLLTDVKNNCIDYLRRKEVESSYLVKQFDKLAEEPPDEICEIAELEEALNKALSKLPDNIRKVFEMNRFQGTTYQEIALQNQISVKTVEAYMTKALKVLRVELKDYLPFFLFLL